MNKNSISVDVMQITDISCKGKINFEIYDVDQERMERNSYLRYYFVVLYIYLFLYFISKT